MSKAGAAGPETSLDSPMVVFKVGMLGAAPLDLMSELADSYDAEYLSSDEVRLELMDEGNGSRVQLGQITDKLAAEARLALADDRDVVLDLFCNTANSRQMPISLARETGGMTVALCFKTPVSLAKSRVRQWTEEDAFLVPVNEWEVPPIVAARRMIDHLQEPSELEDIDYVFNIRGSGSTEAVLRRYDAQLRRAGLLDRYDG